MRKSLIRPVASVAVLVLTGVLFVRYIQTHPGYLAQLTELQWGWVVGILLADMAGITSLAALYQVLVRMTGKQLEPKENWLLTIYSSIANFFGPLQSGPGVRAAYLKAKHKIRLRAYFFATLIAYAVYAILSAFFLLIGTRPWWQSLLATLGAVAISALVLWLANKRKGSGLTSLIITPRMKAAVFGLTALQITFIGMRYYLALLATGAHVTLGQVVSYTGAANFALFVSITPDGIGVREAFLLFAQNIHHVSTEAIVSANLIDRALYVVFLGLLFLLALSLHARQRFSVAPKTNQHPSDSAE